MERNIFKNKNKHQIVQFGGGICEKRFTSISKTETLKKWRFINHLSVKEKGKILNARYIPFSVTF